MISFAGDCRAFALMFKVLSRMPAHRVEMMCGGALLTAFLFTIG